MAALLGKTEYGLKKTGGAVTVPNTPKAKLMYYLSCISTVLDMQDESDMAKLRDYTNYHRLTEAEVDALVALCFLLSPDVLTDKVIFKDDDMCGQRQNAFYELSAVRTNMLLSQSILIGGQTRTVKKIMFFKQIWVQDNWVEPMQHFTLRLALLAAGGPRTAPSRPAIEYNRPALAPPPAHAPARARAAPQPPRVTQPPPTSSSDGGCCCTIL